MICVCIGRGRHRHVIAEHRHLADQGAKLVEIRLDYINGEVNIKRLLAERPCPCIISCRRPVDGGKWAGTETQRLLLLRTAIAEGVEYIDLEEDIAPQIPRFGKTKRIISLHDFRKTPENLEELHQQLQRFDPDIVKIAAMGNHPHDCVRILQLMRNAKIPTIGICMGNIGLPTRVLAGKYGAPFTYATFHHERTLAPGQLSFQQMNEIYQYDKINSETEVYGVIADPIGHSLSPQVHNSAFRHRNMNKVYIPFRVPREDLGKFIEDVPTLELKGISVTIPHKEEVIRYLTEADGAVRGIGAANTVLFSPGKRQGYNTDYRAALDSIEIAWREASEDPTNMLEMPMRGVTALLLGAGGVGRALAYGLVRREANVVISDINARAAAALAQALKCRSVEWGSRHTISADILLNGTPVGMHPNVDETPFDKHYLKPSMLVFDAVYNPENTLLIKEARSRNCRVVTGVEMFVRQACMQFKLFTGEEGPADLMRDVVRRAIAPLEYDLYSLSVHIFG